MSRRAVRRRELLPVEVSCPQQSVALSIHQLQSAAIRKTLQIKGRPSGDATHLGDGLNDFC